MTKLIPLKITEEFAELIGLDIALITQTYALKAHTGFVKRTPVDTGRARANWQIGIGNAAGQTTATDKQAFGSDPPLSPALKQIDGEQVVFITNSLDYIEALENGSSQQAPSGFVRITIARLQAEVDAELAGEN